MKKIDLLRNQIDNDYADLIRDIKAGFYEGNFEEELKVWEKLKEKISCYQNLKEEQKTKC